MSAALQVTLYDAFVVTINQMWSWHIESHYWFVLWIRTQLTRIIRVKCYLWLRQCYDFPALKFEANGSSLTKVLTLESSCKSHSNEFVMMQGQRFRRLQPERFVVPKQVSIVIPTLNEKEGIGKVIDDPKREGFERILVVDGYSDVGTAVIAESRGPIVIHQHGPGKARALSTAIEAVDTPYLLVMDGDDFYNAADAMRFLEHAANKTVKGTCQAE
jgi:hypothetical protein